MATIGVAYTIKTTPVVIVIATVLTAVVAIFDHDLLPARRVGVIVACAASMVAFVALGLGLSAAASSVSRVTRRASTPLRRRRSSGGSPSGPTSSARPAASSTTGPTHARWSQAVTGRSPAEMRAYAAGFLGDRWAERGVGGTLAFYGNKAAWNWGDGMFWAWGEGPDSLPGTLAPATGVTGVVHDLNGFHGSGYPWRADLTQALWLALLLVAGVGLLRAPYRRETLLVALSVLGIAAFTLVLQGRSRYLFAFVPLVVALAASVHGSLPRLAPRARP